MSIGARIKEQRNSLGLTQPKLAEMLGLSLDMVKSLEGDRKKPSIETLYKLHEIFGCSTDYLLGITDEPSGDSSPGKRLAKYFDFNYSDDEIIKAMNFVVDGRELNDKNTRIMLGMLREIRERIKDPH